MLFAYSRDDGSVLRYDVGDGDVRGRDALDADGLAVPAITAAGDTWAVVDTEDGDVWLRGQDAAARAPIDRHRRGRGAGRRAAPTSTSPTTPPSCGCRPMARTWMTEVGGADGPVLGTPAQPITHDGETYAAWLGTGDAGGLLWRSSGGDVGARLRRRVAGG